MCSGVVKRQALEVDVSVFVIGINEFAVLEVLVFVTLADGTIVPANLLINVVMVSWYTLSTKSYRHGTQNGQKIPIHHTSTMCSLRKCA